MMAKMHVYQSLGALVPVRKVLDEAGGALADRGRILLTSGVPEVLGVSRASALAPRWGINY